MAERRRSSVYLETTVVSYLAARPSRDIVVAAHQELTRQWWRDRRDRCELFVSDYVLAEVRRGDAQAASRRRRWIRGLAVLPETEQALRLADRLMAEGALPSKARADALHIACAAAHGIEYLLTWNCRHIANVETRASIERGCRVAGYAAPLLCTREEFMGT